ncbi:hypothetical protein [Runella sp. SP2]|uniref:hypothetical protein n=1 Tax=Runella sp. SP2 TaxID=2268026 RepID=UPI000F098C50|nr:hypothetical protein [Runella sp. SP2]AYQ34678.1 hypothetical protein DTQ70_22010 [Runella sp. SP2]
MKKLLKQFLALTMASLALWAGNGFGVLEHSCQEHGTHRHILSSWAETSCEHQQHEDEHHHHHEAAAGFQAHEEEAQVNFVYCYAEVTTKAPNFASTVFIPFIPSFSAFFYKPTLFQKEEIGIAFFKPSYVFRRTYGRFLLTLVQSFLI